MTTLLRLFSLRHMRVHVARTLLGITAIALGIAIFVSSRVANTSVVAALTEQSRALAGKAEWQVTEGRSIGIDVAKIEPIRRLPGAIAAPIVQTSAVIAGEQDLMTAVLGVEFRNDSLLRLYRLEEKLDAKAALAALLVPDAVFVSRALADRIGVGAMQRLRVKTLRGPHEFTVAGILEETPAIVALGRFVMIADLPLAQRWFGTSGRCDRIEVAGVDRAALESVAPGCLVEPVTRPSSMVEDALARLRSLFAVSVIAVLVGIFIIYNTVSISVVERLKEIGTLRALGARSGTVLRTLMTEWFVIGAVGSAVGIGAGWLLAKTLVAFTAQTINTLMDLVRVERVILDGETVAYAFGIGLLATAAASYWPSRRALSWQPITILRAHSYRMESRPIIAFRIGVALIAVGAALVIWLRGSLAGVAATAVIFTGIALVLPELTVRVAVLVRPVMRALFGVEGFLAADNVTKFPHRTSLTVVTLGGALSMFIASATLIEGFRKATQHWMRDALPFDVAVSSTDFASTVYSRRTFASDIVDDVARFPETEVCYGVRAAFTDYEQQDVMILAIDIAGFLEVHERRGHSPWSRKLEAAAKDGGLSDGKGIVVSENFAAIFGKTKGDVITLRTPSGTREVRILDELEDYSWPHGLIAMDLAAYREIWKDDTLSYCDIRLRPGIDVDAACAAFSARLVEKHSAFVFPVGAIRQLASDTLDQTMSFANIQVLIALVIGCLGIVNTLLISVLQRSREIGLLRAVGMTRRRVAKTVVAEALVIAVFGGVVGTLSGLAGGFWPLRLFALGMTGYWPPMVVPWAHVGVGFVMSVVIGFIASLVPARRAARVPLLEAIGYE